MDPATLSVVVGLLAKVTAGALTALELNLTERLPALRAHAQAIEDMIAQGREPSQAEIDALADGINADIEFVRQRAAEARN